GAEQRALDLDRAGVRRRRAARHAGHVQAGVIRRFALRHEAHALFQRGDVEAAAERAIRGDRFLAVADRQGAGDLFLLVGQQRLAKPRQRDLLLGAQPEPALTPAYVEVAAQLDHARVVLGPGVTALVGQRDHQRGIAQRGAVVAEVAGTVALERETLGNGLLAARLVALHRQRQA